MGFRRGVLHYSVYLLHTLSDTCTAPARLVHFFTLSFFFFALPLGIVERTQLLYEVTLTSFAPAPAGSLNTINSSGL